MIIDRTDGIGAAPSASTLSAVIRVTAGAEPATDTEAAIPGLPQRHPFFRG